MFDEDALLDKLRKIEALHAGTTSEGEKVAAAFAAERIRQRLADWRAREPDVVRQYSIHDPWSRKLFVALCRRYGLEPYRYPRQRDSTLCVRAPEPFQKNTLWPQFLSLDEALRRHLAQVTARVIHLAVHEDDAEAAVVTEPKELPGG
jgi:hypothetical protein